MNGFARFAIELSDATKRWIPAPIAIGRMPKAHCKKPYILVLPGQMPRLIAKVHGVKNSKMTVEFSLDGEVMGPSCIPKKAKAASKTWIRTLKHTAKSIPDTIQCEDEHAGKDMSTIVLDVYNFMPSNAGG